jgi:hypothetical protein
MTESNEEKRPQGQEDPSADAGVPDDATSPADSVAEASAAEAGDTEDMSAPPGPAEEKDRKTPDDRGLTTDTSPSD